MDFLIYALMALMGYLLGCSNMAFYLGILKGINLREVGSGNLGTSNAFIAFGKGAAVLVFLHDAGKAFLAVWLARLLFPGLPLVGAVAGVASVLGHIFTFYLKFKGGKGFASFLGMVLAMNWKLALLVLVVVGLITLITDYIVYATATVTIAAPIAVGILEQSVWVALILLIATAVILYKHRENFVKLMNGTEIGLRHANAESGKASKK